MKFLEDILNQFGAEKINSHTAYTGSCYEQYRTKSGRWITLRYSDHNSFDVCWNGQGKVPMKFDFSTDTVKTRKCLLKTLLQASFDEDDSFDEAIKDLNVKSKKVISKFIKSVLN